MQWWLHPNVFFDRNIAAPRKFTFRRVKSSFVFCAKFMFLPASATKVVMGLRQRRRMLRSTAVLRQSHVSWPAAFILDEADRVCAEINQMASPELNAYSVRSQHRGALCAVSVVGTFLSGQNLTQRAMFGVLTAQSAGFAAALTKTPRVRRAVSQSIKRCTRLHLCRGTGTKTAAAMCQHIRRPALRMWPVMID